MTEADQQPRAVAVMKDNAGSYLFRADDYAQLKADWMAGKAFFDGIGPYGERVTVKLALVEGVALGETPALLARDAAERAREAEQKLREWRGDGEP